ncbi:hypothetical protein IQ266_24570 [filamentous cyanobacterium LEGE 11480]|uniref:Uncharacterized protein n=1 Tax=Romeriopsis navalis LEGE 11480 TaxID=2777977 RepID=A0A928Z5K3_9CYAN|nr:hypothetical protein [Romeriopsis navalis]MBE9032914.1 hypothetical protein [Romeriopsis navalis LEGE 11480]
MRQDELSGAAAGVAGNAKIYADNVILNAERGHGFAAEKANHLKDVVAGKDAKIVGGDNAKNGADRLVNGVNIQTKYCNSGSKCIQECFEQGKFRYLNADGSPMQIEVPSDKYEAAVQAMEARINKGQVPGVTDPVKAQEIVRKGGFTYQQARNIAKFGTIESVTYDAVNGIRVAGTAMGLTAAITFACAVWQGDEVEVALEQACYSGLKVGGVTWVSSVLMAQLGRTGVEKSLRPATDFVVKQMGPKAAAWVANGLRGGSGKAIHGAAAMSNASKLLRGNVVTGVVTTAVLSSVDVARLVHGKISGQQLAKNVTTTAAGVAGGAGGYAVGAGIGTMLLPGVGTVVGGLVGGFLAGSATSSAAQKALDNLIEDDAVAMSKILEQEFEKLAFDYLLSEPEIAKALEQLQGLGRELRNMYAAIDREEYARNLLNLIIEEIVQQRSKVILSSDEDWTNGLIQFCMLNGLPSDEFCEIRP